jgi:hypothetical protein
MRQFCMSAFVVCCAFLFTSQTSEAQLFGRLRSKNCNTQAKCCATETVIATPCVSSCLNDYQRRVALCDQLFPCDPQARCQCKQSAARMYCNCKGQCSQGPVLGAPVPGAMGSTAKECSDALSYCRSHGGMNCDQTFWCCVDPDNCFLRQ